MFQYLTSINQRNNTEPIVKTTTKKATTNNTTKKKAGPKKLALTNAIKDGTGKPFELLS